MSQFVRYGSCRIEQDGDRWVIFDEEDREMRTVKSLAYAKLVIDGKSEFAKDKPDLE